MSEKKKKKTTSTGITLKTHRRLKQIKKMTKWPMTLIAEVALELYYKRVMEGMKNDK